MVTILYSFSFIIILIELYLLERRVPFAFTHLNQSKSFILHLFKHDLIQFP
jgi:hypothetical protein